MRALRRHPQGPLALLAGQSYEICCSDLYYARQRSLLFVRTAFEGLAVAGHKSGSVGETYYSYGRLLRV
jgi:hypothetical protein